MPPSPTRAVAPATCTAISLCVPVQSQCMVSRALPNRRPPRKKSVPVRTRRADQKPITMTTAK
jgi:hypothetical protein